MIIISDPQGNKMLIEKVGTLINIYLYLVSDKKKRLLGYVSEHDKILFIKRVRAKHLHRKSNSYGFNYSLLSIGRKFTNIIINDDYGTYQISKNEILTNGQYLFFKQQGFEKQIFYPINKLKQIT